MSTNNQMEALNPDLAATQSDLVLDTGDFDVFSSLDDIVVEESATAAEAPAKENATEEDAAKEVAAEEETELDFENELEIDTDEDFNFDEDMDEFGDEKESEDPEDEEQEEVEDEDEDSEEVEEQEDEDLEEEVEYDGYMVTLPDGTEINLAEAVSGYRDAQALAEDRKAFDDAKVEFENQGKQVKTYLELAQLEADRVINDYKGFDWNALAREDPQKYVDNKEFLEKYTARSKEIKEAYAEVKEQEAKAETEAFQAKAQACLTELKADIPGWNDEMYNDLMDYAIENGAKEEEITKTVDPIIFKLLHKARQFDNGKQVVKAKVRKALRSPKKVAKSQAKATIKKPSAKATAAKKFDAGELDSIDVFNALED